MQPWGLIKGYGGYSVVALNRGNATPTVDSRRLTQAAATSRRNTLNA